MVHKIICPHCRTKHSVKDRRIGKRVKCAKCERSFIAEKVVYNSENHRAVRLNDRMSRWGLDHPDYGDDLTKILDLQKTDPEMGLTRCRKALEEFLYRWCAVWGFEAGTRRLDELIRDLGKEGLLPKKICVLANTVRELGNVGTHPILDGEEVTARELEVALTSLMLILEWYLRTNAEEQFADEETDQEEDG